jgi:hypothetical protein
MRTLSEEVRLLMISAICAVGECYVVMRGLSSTFWWRLANVGVGITLCLLSTSMGQCTGVNLALGVSNMGNHLLWVITYRPVLLPFQESNSESKPAYDGRAERNEYRKRQAYTERFQPE